MSTIKDFTDLIVWQEAHKLSVSVYKITDTFPKSEQFSLTSQMRRAASSVSANIAEGFGRRTLKDQEHFYVKASGSLYELRDHLYLALDINFINESQQKRFNDQCMKVHQLLHGLLRAHRGNTNIKDR
jgi:four helix bundle protein